jgi:hypothetical protein
MNKRQKKKLFKKTHAGFSPEDWAAYEKLQKLWYDQTITRILAETIKKIPYIAYQEPDVLRRAASRIAERYGISKEELYL